MKLKKLQDALAQKRPLYIVHLQECTVKKAEKDPNNQRKKIREDYLTRRKEPVRYTMPVVREVYLTEIDILADRARCVAPILPFREPILPSEDTYDESTLKPFDPLKIDTTPQGEFSDDPAYCYIDYGKIPLKKIQATRENADKLITPELILKYVKPEFVKKFPQILLYHEKLAEMYPDGADAIEIPEEIEDIASSESSEGRSAAGSFKDKVTAALAEVRAEELENEELIDD